MRLLGRRSPSQEPLTLIAASPALPPPVRRREDEDEALAACADDLQPLTEVHRAEALAVLAAGDQDGRFHARLPALQLARRAYDPQSEAFCRFLPGSATLEVAANAPVHVHHRLVDLAPLLNVAARRLTHTGGLPMCLQDDGAPGHLSFCGHGDVVLLPDPFFLVSAGYRSERISYSHAPSWEQRVSRVLWRGSTTGATAASWRDLQRTRMCLLAASAPEELGLDVGFTDFVQQAEGAQSEIRALGLAREPVPHTDYVNFKYHIDVDGNTNSWSGLFRKLLSGGLVFKVASPANDVQWYYPRLQSWRHYVPVDASLSDLEEKVRWAFAHDDRAAEIAATGRRFAEGLRLVPEATFAIAVIETELARRQSMPLGLLT